MSWQQVKTLVLDRDYYINKGFPKAVAKQYAYDHMFAAVKGIK